MTPHQCPVCVGEGEVPDYPNSHSFTTYVVKLKECPACKGACVLWEPGSSLPLGIYNPDAYTTAGDARWSGSLS